MLIVFTLRIRDGAIVEAGSHIWVPFAEGLLSGHRIDHKNLNPLGRIAGRAYCKTQDVVHV